MTRMAIDTHIKKDLMYNWHPFMQMKDFEAYPPRRIIRSDGLKLFGEDTWYYDTISSWWCNILGHGHPVIKAALAQQIATLDHIMFANFTHDGAITLSERLVKVTPKGLDRVYYSDNGSTAVEVAMKLSLNYWLNIGTPNKTKMVCFDGSYHGDTIGAMSASGVSRYSNVFKPLMFDAINIANPAVNEDDALRELAVQLDRFSDEVAAVLVEPGLMGAGGMQLTSHAFYRSVRELTRQYNVHLISDEVATGFGRTGDLFVSTGANVSPDFMCLSKALTNGQMPLAVTLLTDDVFQAFYADFKDGKTFYHGHTFTANPLACAAANATLDVLESWDWQSHVHRLATIINQRLQDIAERMSPFVVNPRCKGMVGAFDMPLSGDRSLFHLSQRAFDYHLTIRPLGNTVYVFLPLVTTDRECHDIFDRMVAWLDDAKLSGRLHV